MCGFGMDLIFKVAIFVVVVLVVLALLRVAFGEWFAGVQALPYWNIVQIVIGGVIAILVLLFIWRLAECAGLFGRIGLTDMPVRIDKIALHDLDISFLLMFGRV